MKTYDLEIEIDAPRAQVAECFADPNKIACWQPGFLGLERLEGEEDQPGEKILLKYNTNGRKVDLLETIEVHNLPDEFTSTFETKGMHMRVANFFEEISPDRTRMITKNEATVSGLMMRLITLIMPSCFKKQSYLYMENFKALVETGADVRDQKK